MKVLITLTYYRPYISGLTKYAQNLAEGLAKRKHQVVVLAMKHGNYLKAVEKANGVKVIRATPIIRISKGFLSLDWIWQSIKLVSQTDAVITNLPEPEAAITALAAKAMGKRLIAIYHCDVSGGNKLLERALDICNSLVLHLADKVVTNTKDYAKSSRILPRFVNKTEYIFPIIKEPEPKKSRNHEFTIGWIGRISKEKGLEYLLETLPSLKKEIKNLKVVLAGPTWTVGEEKHQAKIKQMIRQSEGKAIQVGQLTDEQLSHFYKKIDLLALPSINSTETLGMVQLEAMAAGVPTVASNLPGVRQPILITGMGEIFNPGDSKQLRQAILKIYKNYAKYTKNKPKALSLFSPEKALDAYEHQLFP